MMQHNIQRDTWKQMAGTAAVELIEDGMAIGLGTGSTASYFIYALAQRIRSGLRIAGAVPTSQTSKELASNLGIPLTDLNTHPELDLYVDGTDEIDQNLRLIKGAGGALLREKIVASVSRRFTVIADMTKQVQQLGQNAPLPVEVIPFALTPVHKRLEKLGARVQLRRITDNVFVTENNNVLLDCAFPDGINDPEALDARIHSIVGVVETGFFLHMAQQAIIGGPEGVRIIP